MTDEAPPPPERPIVELTFERAFCALHGEPYREAWPKGYPTAAVLLLRDILNDENTWEEAARLLGKPVDTIDPKQLESVLDLKPACCRVARKRLREIYVESSVGYVMRCKICRKFGLGTRYETTAISYRHICFGCVTERLSATPLGVH